MIDMHCHLDLYPNALDILERTNQDNIFTLAVTTSPRAWLATTEVFKNYSNIYVSLGMHPEIIESKSNEIDLLMGNIKKTNFIGEVGIDGSSRYSKTFALQKEVFENVLKESEKQKGKIISIHSRKAVKTVLDSIEKYPRCGKAVLHWFSGTQKELERAISLDCWFSVNPKMLKSKKGLSLIKKIPKNRLFPETDGPFVSIDNNFLYPWDAISISNELAFLWECYENEVLLQMKQNLKKLIENLGDSQ